jgi:hypothetical protein
MKKTWPKMVKVCVGVSNVHLWTEDSIEGHQFESKRFGDRCGRDNAQKLLIASVHRHTMYLPGLSVADNISTATTLLASFYTLYLLYTHDFTVSITGFYADRTLTTTVCFMGSQATYQMSPDCSPT